jgi:hypothetical protein
MSRNYENFTQNIDTQKQVSIFNIMLLLYIGNISQQSWQKYNGLEKSHAIDFYKQDTEKNMFVTGKSFKQVWQEIIGNYRYISPFSVWLIFLIKYRYIADMLCTESMTALKILQVHL